MYHCSCLKFAVFLCATFSLTVDSAAADPVAEKSLVERAQTLWGARVNGDWSTVYRFFTQQEQASVSVDRFVDIRKTKGPFAYRSAEVGEVAVAGDLGWVDISYTADLVAFPQLPSRNVRIWDIWHIRNGQWYPIPKEIRAQVPQLPPRLRSTAEAAALARRANEFWKAKERQDWARIYGYLEPSYQARVSKEEFLKRKALYAYFAHSFEWVEVIEGRGRVKVKSTRKPKDPTLDKLESEENITIEEWVKVDGQWYFRVVGG